MNDTSLAYAVHTMMKHSIVRFTFRKKDGTIRNARGTRNLSLASADLGYSVRTPKGEEQPNSYYDLDKDGWRSYIPENVLRIDGVDEPRQHPTEQEETDNAPKLGGIAVELPPTFGKGTEEKINKAIERLGKEIDLSPIGGGIGIGVSLGKGTAKVGKPSTTPIGVALPISGVGGTDNSEMTIDDFAKLVAKYVVAELVEKLTR